MVACSFSSSRLCARIFFSSGSVAASTRWSYQSIASSSSMIETIARCRSMVSGFRDCSFSCREPLLPAMRFNLLALDIRQVSTHERCRGSVQRAAWFFALSALALLASVLYYWLTLPLPIYLLAPVQPAPAGLPALPLRLRERLAVVAACGLDRARRGRDRGHAMAATAAWLAVAAAGRDP